MLTNTIQGRIHRRRPKILHSWDNPGNFSRPHHLSVRRENCAVDPKIRWCIMPKKIQVFSIREWFQ